MIDDYDTGKENTNLEKNLDFIGNSMIPILKRQPNKEEIVVLKELLIELGNKYSVDEGVKCAKDYALKILKSEEQESSEEPIEVSNLIEDDEGYIEETQKEIRQELSALIKEPNIQITDNDENTLLKPFRSSDKYDKSKEQDYLLFAKTEMLKQAPGYIIEIGLENFGKIVVNKFFSSDKTVELDIDRQMELIPDSKELASDSDIIVVKDPEKKQQKFSLEGNLLPNKELHRYVAKLGESIQGQEGAAEFLNSICDHFKEDSNFYIYKINGEPKRDEEGKPYYNLNLINPLVGDAFKHFKYNENKGIKTPRNYRDIIVKKENQQQEILNVIKGNKLNIDPQAGLNIVNKRLEDLKKKLDTTSIPKQTIENEVLEALAPKKQKPSYKNNFIDQRKDIIKIDNKKTKQQKTIPPKKSRIGSAFKLILAGIVGGASTLLLSYALNKSPKTEIDYEKIAKERNKAINSKLKKYIPAEQQIKTDNRQYEDITKLFGDITGLFEDIAKIKKLKEIIESQPKKFSQEIKSNVDKLETKIETILTKQNLIEEQQKLTSKDKIKYEESIDKYKSEIKKDINSLNKDILSIKRKENKNMEELVERTKKLLEDSTITDEYINKRIKEYIDKQKQEKIQNEEPVKPTIFEPPKEEKPKEKTAAEKLLEQLNKLKKKKK